LCVAALVYISRPIGKAPAAQAPTVMQVEPKKPVPVPPKEPTRFSFYEMLPSYEVVIPNGRNDKGSAGPIAFPLPNPNGDR